MSISWEAHNKFWIMCEPIFKYFLYMMLYYEAHSNLNKLHTTVVNMEAQLNINNEFVCGKDEVWLMGSNTPHETLLIDQGKRRTFMRITLAHNYDNAQIFGLEAVA